MYLYYKTMKIPAVVTNRAYFRPRIFLRWMWRLSLSALVKNPIEFRWSIDFSRTRSYTYYERFLGGRVKL